MSPAFLSIKQAIIGYSGQPVLSGIDLQIYRGQHWAFAGESSSGKTSLLNAIAGNLQLRKGDIIRHFAQTDNGLADFHQLIAFVGAKPHFRNLSNTSDLYYQQRYNSSDSDDALTVAAYLDSVHHTDNDADHWNITNTIALLKLAHLADKQLIKLSNGEARRLMIAAALIKNPQLLLLDNPLAGLDIQTRAEFNNIIDEIAASGITIIMATSSHELPDAVTNIGVLKNGSIQLADRQQFNALLPAQQDQQYTFYLNDLLDRYPAHPYQDIVRMRDVTIKYGSKTILKGVNWQIQQGERWALLGHNGAGKSTLLSLINGDNPQAYANDITLFDKKRGSGESIWDIKQRTGFISPELYQYFPADSSCSQAIESGYYDTMGLFRPSNKGRAERAMQWMKVLGIEQHARQLLKNMPASAQRLCLLARAMIKCPPLLILDEPTQGMDDHQVQHFRALVDAICAQTNITLIYVTHYADHIPGSVQHVLELKNGEVVR